MGLSCSNPRPSPCQIRSAVLSWNRQNVEKNNCRIIWITSWISSSAILFWMFCENACDARSCEAILSRTRRKKKLAENPDHRLWWNKRIWVSSGLMWGHFTLCEEVPFYPPETLHSWFLVELIFLCVWH